MKEEHNTPQLEEWRRLYEAATSFRDLAPWTFASEKFIFGIEDPETGTIGYASVLGGSEEVYALVVYEGTEGLNGIIHLINHAGDFTPEMVLEYQHALMASFEDREILEKEDLQTIRALGIKYRGRKQWPMFRHYLPGYIPWFLSGPQVRFLTLCVEQALDVLPRFREHPDLLTELGDEKYLIRSRQIIAGQEVWQDRTMPAPEPPSRSVPKISVDEVTIARIQRQQKSRGGTWEVGFIFAPAPVQESPSDRPFLPRLMLVCDAETGMIITFHMERDDHAPMAFRDHLLEFSSPSISYPPRSPRCILS